MWQRIALLGLARFLALVRVVERCCVALGRSNIRWAKGEDVTQPIAYVVVREDLWGPVIRSQVVEVLEGLEPTLLGQIVLLWFVRLDVLLRSRKQIRATRKDLHSRGLRLATLPFVAWRFPVAWFLLPLVVTQWLVGLLWVYFRFGCRVFHCRSYHAGLAGLVLKRLTGVRLIFDPRSPFPEENVAAKRWVAAGLNHRLWKALESRLVQGADRIIATSGPFARALEQRGGRGKVVSIPNNYCGSPPSKVESDSHPAPLLCYVGSLGTWNNAELYLEFIERLAPHLRFRFRFLVPESSRRYLQPVLEGGRVAQIPLSVDSVAQQQVLQELGKATAGVQILAQSDRRLGIKFVEYLAAGLPVLVSETVEGAADMVRTHGVGLVMRSDGADMAEVATFLREVHARPESWRKRCQGVAMRQFSREAVARRLQDLYRTL